MNYILEEHTPIACSDIVKWALWFETADRRVALDTVSGIKVSTVFLGIDHNYGYSDRPILFETMCLTEIDWLDMQLRYATWEEAEIGHKLVIEQLRGALPTVTV